MTLVSVDLPTVSYHHILHVHPKKERSRRTTSKDPIYTHSDRIQKYNVGTLRIHAKHSLSSPSWLNGALNMNLYIQKIVVLSD